MEILTRKQAIETCKDISAWTTNTALMMHANGLITMEALKDIAETQKELKSLVTAISLNFGEGKCKN